jgi:hypothetical protein
MKLVRFKNGKYAIRRWSDNGRYEFFYNLANSWMTKEDPFFGLCLFSIDEKEKALTILEQLSDMGTEVITEDL